MEDFTQHNLDNSVPPNLQEYGADGASPLITRTGEFRAAQRLLERLHMKNFEYDSINGLNVGTRGGLVDGYNVHNIFFSTSTPTLYVKATDAKKLNTDGNSLYVVPGLGSGTGLNGEVRIGGDSGVIAETTTVYGKNIFIQPTQGIYIPTLATSVTAPATSGTTYTVVSDDQGQLSYTKTGSSFPYGTSAYRNTSVQSIPASTITKVQLNAELWDFSNEFDPTTNFRYTALTDGYYIINFGVYFTATEDAKFYNVFVFKNNSTTVCQNTSHSGSTSELGVGGSMFATLVAGDYLELYVFHNSVAAKNLSNGQGITYFNIQRII